METTVANVNRLAGPDAPAMQVLGSEIQCLLSGEQTGGEYALFVTTAPPGDPGPPPHRHHREHETFYVLEGQLNVWDGEHEAAAGPGTAIHLPQGQWHRYWNAGDQTTRFLVVARPAGIEHMFAAIDRLCRAGGEPDMGALVQVIEEAGVELRLPE